MSKLEMRRRPFVGPRVGGESSLRQSEKLGATDVELVVSENASERLWCSNILVDFSRRPRRAGSRGRKDEASRRGCRRARRGEASLPQAEVSESVAPYSARGVAIPLHSAQPVLYVDFSLCQPCRLLEMGDGRSIEVDVIAARHCACLTVWCVQKSHCVSTA